MERPIEGKTIVMIVAQEYEDIELLYPLLRLSEAGGRIDRRYQPERQWKASIPPKIKMLGLLAVKFDSPRGCKRRVVIGKGEVNRLLMTA